MGRAMGDMRDVCNNNFNFYDYLYEFLLIKASVMSSLTLIILYFWFSFFSYGLLV